MVCGEIGPILLALGGKTRWRIVHILALRREVLFSEIGELIGVDWHSLSKHVRILREACIIVTRKEKRIMSCAIRPEIIQRSDDGSATMDFGWGTFRFETTVTG
jgi:DNA-binding transcriptional ArsR family regulator